MLSSRLLTAGLVALALLLSGCSGPQTPAIPTVTLRAGDFFFDAPDSIPAGLVDLVMTNDGKEAHQAQLARLKDGVTLEQLQEALKKGHGEALPLVELTGGPGVTDPRGRSETVVQLKEGQYVLLCFIPSPDGVPHFAKGMIRPLRVVAGPGAPAALPSADATITLRDFGFVAPPALKAGNQIWKVVNEGVEPHEMTIVQMDSGKSAKDLIAWAVNPTGTPPFRFVGGLRGMGANQTAWMTVDLSPGRYTLVCFIPSLANRASPHVALGMSAEITVG